MGIEVERKFLVKGDFKSHAVSKVRIIQGYLSSVPERTVRVRMKGLGVDLQLPLALSVIGGLTVGTVASLYFAPLVYYLFYRKKTHK